MSERRLITVALFVATFLVALDQSVVSTAMPTVIGQIGGLNLYAWVFSAYLLSSTVTVPIYGKLADLYGRKPVFMASTLIFLVGSMLCGQAQTMEQLIVFRLLQGLGAGGVLPINQTILGDIFPLEQRARITGVFSTIWGVAGLLGPAIGGALTEHVSWRWVFYVNFPLCVLSMVLLGAFLKEKVERRSHQIDVLGALTLSAAVAALLLGLQSSDSPARQALLYGAAIVLLPVFVWQERRAPEPLVPLFLFGQRMIGISTLGGVLTGFVLLAQSAFVPPFIQGVIGVTPTLAGFVLAGTSIGWPIASFIGGRLLLRWGFRGPCILGGALLVVGFAMVWATRADSPLWWATFAQVVLGFGFGFYNVTTILAAQSAVGWEYRGVVTSASQFARNMGGTLGVSIAGAMFSVGIASAAIGGANANDLLSPDLRGALPPGQLEVLRTAVAGALGHVYVLFIGISVLATIVAALLPGGAPSADSGTAGADETLDRRVAIAAPTAATVSAGPLGAGQRTPTRLA